MTALNETKVLALLASGDEDFGVMSFSGIRRTCRALKRKGLAEFYRGCWTEDGAPAGSGYGATAAGREAADGKLVEKFVNKRWQ